MHIYTKDEKDYLQEIVFGRSHKEIAALFNLHFDLDLSVGQIKGAIARYKLHTGRDGRFRPGDIPYNKGKKKWYAGGEATQFKSGNRPWNYKPVGTERTNTDGYVEIKIADPKTWKGKHLIIWEQSHGPVPKGYAVIFADGNKQNVVLENLLLVSRRELAVLNKKGLISPDAELTKAGVTIANIHMKITERKRQKKEERKRNPASVPAKKSVEV